MELQNKNVLLSAGISNEAVNAYLPLYINIMKLTAESEDRSELTSKTKELVTNWLNIRVDTKGFNNSPRDKGPFTERTLIVNTR